MKDKKENMREWRQDFAKKIEKNGVSRSLALAVIDRLDPEDEAEIIRRMKDVREHGADGGFHGFCYYSETRDFFKKNREAIASLVERMAEDLGEDPIRMVTQFRCLEGYKIKPGIVGRLLWRDGKSEYDFAGYDDVANALAWFALEEVARAAGGIEVMDEG